MTRRDLLGLAAATATVGCSQQAADDGLREISLSLSERLTLSGAYLAEEVGYFRDAGFSLNILRLSGLQTMPLLAGGRLDLVFSPVNAGSINAMTRGLPLRVVAGREVANPNCGETFSLFAHRSAFDGGSIEPRRLKGKRFAVRSGGMSNFVLDTFLDEVGMTSSDIEQVDLSVREAIAALSTGTIDALFDSEFSYSLLATSPDVVKVWRFAEARPFHQYSYIIFGETLLQADVKVGARFLAAYLKGAGDFLDGRTPQFMRDFAASHGLDEKITVSACRDTFVRDGSIDLKSLQAYADWHVKSGRVQEPVDVSTLIDLRFLEEAQRMLADDSWRTSNPGGPAQP